MMGFVACFRHPNVLWDVERGVVDAGFGKFGEVEA